ncbi:MAG: polysaccharide biosynthesis protein [Anaerolineales bacterium]|nr:polysaccharide biosynthesis protein [Anaerolineales bacterium]
MKIAIKDFLKSNLFLVLDLVAIVIAAVGSFVLRLDLEQLVLDYLPTIFWAVILALIVKPLIFWRFGLYRRLWSYASVREMRTIITSVSVASLLTGTILFGMFKLQLFHFFPRSVVIIDWLVTMGIIASIRFASRLQGETQGHAPRSGNALRKVLLVGAGDAGALVLRELQKNPQLNLEPKAFLDDDPNKKGLEIRGIPVAGNINDLAMVVEEFQINEVIIAIPSAGGDVVRRVAEACQKSNVPFKTMPGIYELLGGNIGINRLREVEITDLLRRPPVTIDNDRVGESLQNKRILVTGAGGSIASELCRQISRWQPEEIILVGHGENSIFNIMLELQSSFPSVQLLPVIADIRDRERLEKIFSEYKPQIVFHAAAHKHVLLMELNVEEAITNNIVGTLNVVTLSGELGIEKLVMISTDKAVNPTCVMGATKKTAEMIVLNYAKENKKSFCVVRFGNVLGSRGSVLPKFKKQIDQGGPVTITHPDMERYFMTIPEAVHLVLQASSLGENGNLFVLDMGKPVKIVDLAEDLIRLAGYVPREDIPISFTGIKPGEKLSEKLWDDDAIAEFTEHPSITRLTETNNLEGTALAEVVDNLVSCARKADVKEILRLLDAKIPGASIQESPPSDIDMF